MNKQLIQDCIEFKQLTPLQESVRGRNRYVVEGVLQRANAPNQNGRSYPKPILEREVNNYLQEKVSDRRALGELDHPESNVVNLKNVSHNILDIKWQGNDLVGKIEVLDTPSGKILKELFNADITLGISSRGLGSVKQLDESTVEVQEDFELICWDFVSDPSTHGAFMRPVNEGKLNESKKLHIDKDVNRLITEIVCDISGECCINKLRA